MKQEEMNTQLYEKLAAEQTKYRDWLMGQPPEEILNHAYEYAVREDILAAAELMDIPQAQAAALLAVRRAAQGPRRGAGAADSQGQRRPHFAEYRAWRQRTGKGHSQLRC